MGGNVVVFYISFINKNYRDSMFVKNKTKLQIEQGKVENLLRGFKNKVTGELAKSLRSVLGTKSIMRVQSDLDSIEVLTGAQYSVLTGNGLVWVDGVAFSDTDFIGLALSREVVSKSAYMYAGGDRTKVGEVAFNPEKPLGIFEESFVSHLSGKILPLFDAIALRDQLINEEGGFPSRLSETELSLDAIRDVYIDEIALNVEGVILKVGIVVSKGLLGEFDGVGGVVENSLDSTVKRKVEIDVGAFYVCETMCLEDVVNLEVGDLIPLIELSDGSLNACLKSSNIELSSSGVIGTNSTDQIIFKCN